MLRRAFVLTACLAVGACGALATTASAKKAPRIELNVWGTSDITDSRLLSELIKPKFEKAFPEYGIEYTAVGSGAAIFCQTVQSVAIPGTSNMAASAIPTRDRARSDQPSASRIRRLTDVSSRKSMLSANSETEPIEIAALNSTKK